MLINIHDAKTHFSKLINQALAGEEIIIARGGRPLIKLTPYTAELPIRQGGQLKDIIQIADDFDAPLPATLLEEFYKKDL